MESLQSYKASLEYMKGHELANEEQRLKRHFRAKGLGDQAVWNEAQAYAQAFIDVQNEKAKLIAKKYGKKHIARSRVGFYR